MLTKSEFMTGIRILQNNYGRKFTTEQLTLFYENLRDMSKEKYIENIKKHVKSNQFLPNIAQLRGENKTIFAVFEQRDYSNTDFSNLYANKGA